MTSPTDAMELSDAGCRAIRNEIGPQLGYGDMRRDSALIRAGFRAGRSAGTVPLTDDEDDVLRELRRSPLYYSHGESASGLIEDVLAIIKRRLPDAAPVPPMVKETALVESMPHPESGWEKHFNLSGHSGSAPTVEEARYEASDDEVIRLSQELVRVGCERICDDVDGISGWDGDPTDTEKRYKAGVSMACEEIKTRIGLLNLKGSVDDLIQSVRAAPNRAAAPKSAGSNESTEVEVPPPPAEQEIDVVVNAQHEETGRIWRGRRSKIPHRYAECINQPSAEQAAGTRERDK